MSELKIKLVRSGMKALLNSQGAAETCLDLAMDVAGRTGELYAVTEPRHSGQRVFVNVYPASKEASDDNVENDTLRRTVQGMEILL